MRKFSEFSESEYFQISIKYSKKIENIQLSNMRIFNCKFLEISFLKISENKLKYLKVFTYDSEIFITSKSENCLLKKN